MAGRDTRRVVAGLGVTCAVLAVIAACGYVFWGWVAFFSRPEGRFPGMMLRPWDPAEQAELREKALMAVRWALVFKYSGAFFGGIAIGCAGVTAWRERHAWRGWPWPSIVCFVPALFALVLTLFGAAKHTALKVALVVEVVSMFAALFDLRRGEAGSPSRPLSWTVLIASLLAILIRPLLPWR